ncbi:putative lipid II flippase FtsW [Verticiella sediminum]|uniref:Probable peptidoglycan glycosyltransferase FtsW n=1 Tax=Verticiella sediminum TaxID=1247510 RepID=A0A556A8B8_9BURK|nr:putative lipid II flippase FtsW [Verticiella sediminum]TSH89134.1 putative lipid II flippase FtsW [Verticiella sediminum]
MAATVPGRSSSGINAVRPGRTRMLNYDVGLVVAISAVVLFGLVMVYSASVALADGPRFEFGRQYFLIRHTVFLTAGLLIGAFVFSLSMATWQRLAMPLFLGALGLLVIVLIPGIGREVNGAYRWLPLGFGINLQPSEVMKFAAVVYAADYTVRKQEHMQTFFKGFLPLAFAMGAAGVLLLLEPDLGAFVVIVAIMMGIMFLGGVSGRLFGGLTVLMVSVFLLLIWTSPWRRARLFAYLDPWHEDYVLGKGYQLSHSLIALGRGEWTGVGLGGSVEKLHYLPEAHTDFILAVIGEELGFVGVLCVMLVFAFIVRRAFEIGRQAIAMDRTFSGLIAMGVALWIGVQCFIHMGVCLGLLPTKGLTLPLVSYGGSGLIANLCAVGLLLRVDFENRVLMRGGRP